MSPGEEGGGEGEIRDHSHTQQINGISIVRMRRLGVGRELRQEGGWRVNHDTALSTLRKGITRLKERQARPAYWA